MSRRSQMKTEYSAFRNEWIQNQGIDMDGKSFSELKAVIREFREKNSDILRNAFEEKGASLEGELHSLTKQHLDADDFTHLRERLQLPKWVSLSEAVAFIKTVLDTDNQNIKEKYANYAASTFSLNDMREVLAFENDVKPARLDTDIYHQSPHRSRSAVEIVSNAVDAVNPTQYTIGRFGVGFYQILAHLQSQEDSISVQTGSQQNGWYEVGFRTKNDEIQTHLEAIKDPPHKNGTIVELKTQNFPQEEAENLIREHFAYNTIARVFLNGEWVNDLSAFDIKEQKALPSVEVTITENGYKVIDTGIGMTPQVILEKLLVPKLTGKAPVEQMVDIEKVESRYMVEQRKEDDHEKGKAVITVGGVFIEQMEFSGINTPKTLVIDLPPFTILGEERNKIAVDRVTISAVKKLIDDCFDKGDIRVLNALAPLVDALQRRSLYHHKEHNLVSYLQEKAREILPKDPSYFPNVSGFERLRIDNVVLVDPLLKQTRWSAAGGIQIPQMQKGGSIYLAPLQEDPAKPAIQYKNRLIVDQALYDKFKGDPTLLNIYLEAHAKGEAVEERELAGGESFGIERKERERAEYLSFEDFVVKNYAQLGFANQDSAEIFVENMSQEEKSAGANVYDYIIKNFPEETAYHFTDRLDRLKQGQLQAIASLAQNKDLVQQLHELNSVPLYYPEQEFKMFPGRQRNIIIPYSKFHKWYLEKELYGSIDVDFETLIHESGAIFKGQVRYKRINNMDYSMLNRSKIDGTVAFVDMDKKEYYPITFPCNEDETAECAQFYNQQLVAIKSKNMLTTARGTHQLCNYIKLYAFDTGEEFNPASHLGTLAEIKDDILIYRKSGEHHYSKNAKYVAYLPDGSTQELGTDGDMWEAAEAQEKTEDARRREQREKERKERLGYISVENDKVELIIGGKAVHRSSYDKNVQGEVQISEFRPKKAGEVVMKVFEVDNHKYILWNFAKRTDEIVSYELIEGPFFKIENEGILFDSNGNIIFQALPNEFISIIEINNKKYLRVEQNDIIVSDTIDERNIEYPLLKRYRYRDIPSGKELTNKDMKEVINTDRVPMYGRWGAYENNESGDCRKFSPFTGESWDIHFSQNPDKSFSGGRSLIIVDRATSQPIIDQKFTQIIYKPEQNHWECVSVDEEKQVINNNEVSFNRVYYLDAQGKVVKQRLWKKPVNGLISSRIRDYRYSINVSMGDYPERDFITIEQDILYPLSREKTNIIQQELTTKDIQDYIIANRFTGRSMRCGYLDDDVFQKIAPSLLQVEYFNERLARPEIINTIDTRLREFDEETKVWFYRFLSKWFPKEREGQALFNFLEKCIRIFEEKIANQPEQEKEDIFNTFEQLRDYDEKFLVTGWNIVRFKTPVHVYLIPEKIRPIVEFLRQEEAMQTQAIEQVRFETSQKLTLSKLIQTKRLNETAVQKFSGTPHELGSMVEQKTAKKPQDHIQREIIHPIYYQGVDNPYLFIRELVQNAHDAAIKTGADEDKQVLLDIFARSENEITLRIEDKVGMSLQEVLNYFLIPGETTKRGDAETIGYFGQGLFTLFRGTKEAVLKTSAGDGVITKLRMEPIKDEHGIVYDIELALEQEQGVFKGTIVEKTVATPYPEVEAAYIKNAASTFCSLVDKKTIEINMNRQELNAEQKILAAVEIPDLGELTLYDAPNNVVTQRGLYIKPIDSDYDTNMWDVETLLRKRGVVIDIPSAVALTRSRGEIARKEAVLPHIQEFLPLLKLKAYIEIFNGDIEKGAVIQLDNLPYDYFYMGYSTSGKIVEDAQKLRRGEPITDVEDYLERGNLIQLLIHLPVVVLDNKTWSLAELKEAALYDAPPLESQEKYHELPRLIREKLLSGREVYEHRERARKEAEAEKRIVEDFTFENWQNQPEFIKTQMQKDVNAYEKMNQKAIDLCAKMAHALEIEPAVRTTFYNEPGSIAHASHLLNMIGWNLNFWKGWHLRAFEEEESSHERLREFFETFTHEYAHILEKSAPLTHNQDFYKRQAEVLGYLMKADLEDK